MPKRKTKRWGGVSSERGGSCSSIGLQLMVVVKMKKVDDGGVVSTLKGLFVCVFE